MVRNEGTTSISEFDVNYSIGTKINKVYTWRGSIDPNSETTITLPAINVSIGQNILKTTLILDQDSYTENNTAQIYFNRNENHSARCVFYTKNNCTKNTQNKNATLKMHQKN